MGKHIAIIGLDALTAINDPGTPVNKYLCSVQVVQRDSATWGGGASILA
jgi:hypothetical protein